MEARRALESHVQRERATVIVQVAALVQRCRFSILLDNRETAAKRPVRRFHVSRLFPEGWNGQRRGIEIQTATPPNPCEVRANEPSDSRGMKEDRRNQPIPMR